MNKYLLSALFALATLFLQAQTIYVKPNATGSGNSWADACDLETAVKKATSGAEVWVQAGTYNPSTMLTVSSSVKLYGSFAGTESSIAARNMASNPTIIDAQNKYGSVVRLEPSAVLNGFTIQNGNAQGKPQKNGGGVFADDNAVIENCKIVNNYALVNGGGVYAKEGVEIINSTIENNTTVGKGNDVYGCCVTIDASSKVAPFICSHPSIVSETRFYIIDTTDFSPLFVSVTGSGTLTYQWYSNTINSIVGGTPVGTNSSSYTPLSDTIGGTFYFVVVSSDYGIDTSNISGARVVAPPVTNFDYSGSPQAITLYPGTYEVECWGASGGTQPQNTNPTCKGGYTKGKLELSNTQTLYVIVGQQGKFSEGPVGYAFGGGGNNANGWSGGVGSGGGASSISINSGGDRDINFLRGRIMVAGAGSGNANEASPQGGWGGGLVGGYTNSNTPGTQTSGFAFGYGTNNKSGDDAGGGGGYYGGGSSSVTLGSGGPGGGSSFISGHPGCNAINEDGTHRNAPTHYSNLVFTETVMIAGNAVMPNPRAITGNITGNLGNGYVRITRIK